MSGMIYSKSTGGARIAGGLDRSSIDSRGQHSWVNIMHAFECHIMDSLVTTTYLATPQSELARAVHAHTICLRFKHPDTNDCIEVIYGSHRPSICVWARASRADLRTETELYALSRTSALLTDTAHSQTIGHGKGEGKGGLQSSLRTCACGLEIWRMQEHRGATITKTSANQPSEIQCATLGLSTSSGCQSPQLS
jgi:hypothetical protein